MFEIRIKKTHGDCSVGEKYFLFFVQLFKKTEKFVTQLFVQKHSGVLVIRDHAFLSFLASHTHQLQGAELKLADQRKNNPEPYHKRYKFYDFHRTSKKFQIGFAPRKIEITETRRNGVPDNSNFAWERIRVNFPSPKIACSKSCSKV